MPLVYYPGCPDDQTPFICTDCPVKELGDIRGAAVVKEGFAFIDITNEVEWQQGINDGDIFVFTKTKGTLESAENLVPGFGDTIEELDSYTHTVNITIENYIENCEAWNDIKRNQTWKLYYRTQTQGHISAVTVLVVPKAPIGEGKTTGLYRQAMFKWQEKDIPCNTDIPTGIFERCVQAGGV